MLIYGLNFLTADSWGTRKDRGDKMSENEKICPDCAETIKQAAQICKHCGYRFLRPTTDDPLAPVIEAPSIQVPANEGRGPVTVNFVRQANWYAILAKLTLYADDVELGKIGAGEELAVTLPNGAQYVYGEMQGFPMSGSGLLVDQLENGDTVFIRSTATLFNFISFKEIPMAFEIMPPDTYVEVGSKSDKIRTIVKAFAVAILLIVASIAWVKEGWRLSGYDTEEQMQTAEAGGFSDKETFLAAQAAGISTAGDWGKFLLDMSKAGFDNPSEFIAFLEQEKVKKEEAERIALGRERRAREEERRNKLLETASFWKSCSFAAEILISVGNRLNRDNAQYIEVRRLSNQVALGHLVLSGKSTEEASKLLENMPISGKNIGSMRAAIDSGNVIEVTRLAIENLADCATKMQNPDADLVYVLQNPTQL